MSSPRRLNDVNAFADLYCSIRVDGDVLAVSRFVRGQQPHSEATIVVFQRPSGCIAQLASADRSFCKPSRSFVFTNPGDGVDSRTYHAAYVAAAERAKSRHSSLAAADRLILQTDRRPPLVTSTRSIRRRSSSTAARTFDDDRTQVTQVLALMTDSQISTYGGAS